MKNALKVINEQLTFQIGYADLFDSYCSAKGIDDPEEELDDATYAELMEEFERKLTYEDLQRISIPVWDYITGFINNKMEEVAVRREIS